MEQIKSFLIPLQQTLDFNGILPPLHSLDRLLERAIAVAETVYGVEAVPEPDRELHVSQGEVE